MKVGDYVRTDKGLIGKVIKKEEYDTHIILEYEGQYCKRVLTTSGTDSEVIKSSPNIIDLIEVGDYVNGCMVVNKNDDTIQIIQLIIPFDLKEKDIKSVVTKEQFSQMKYKVGE